MTADAAREAIASTDFRDAMRRHAAAVHVVTTNGPAGRRGVTVSSACSVSDDPPTVLVCLNVSSPLNERFEINRNFALNLLSEKDEPVARAFAGQNRLEQAARFDLGDWTREETGAPLLTSALAAFDCRLVEARIVATHWILIGEVVGLRTGPKGRALLYLDRDFHSL